MCRKKFLILVQLVIIWQGMAMKIIWQPEETTSGSNSVEDDTTTTTTVVDYFTVSPPQPIPTCIKPKLTEADLINCRNHELPSSYGAKCWMHCMREKLDLPLLEDENVDLLCRNVTQSVGMYS